ncbi:MAG: NAD-dependent epimerase/dehydratase family protein [Motiliproteus sp.]
MIRQHYSVRGLVRDPGRFSAAQLGSVDLVKISGLEDEVAIARALAGIDVVVHLAARVHAMDDTQAQDSEYDRVNHQGTLTLARLAKNAGVRRFIFLSSIKVNGEERVVPYSAADVPNPQDAYARSKYRAESALLAYGQASGFDVVVIRPPLIYGAGVKANFLQLIRWVKRGIPLPLAGLTNRRTLVSITNLVDLVRVCVVHPQAEGQIFLVSDGEAVSTSTLIRRIAQAYGVKPRLFYCPDILLRMIAKLLRRSSSADRLLGSLAVDITHTQQCLDWQPPATMLQTLVDMARQDKARIENAG